MDISRLKNNEQYFIDYVSAHEVTMWLKESPEFNLHIGEMYFGDVFGNPIFNNKPWVGFTRDYQEFTGGWKDASEIEDIDEYIYDMLRYKDRERRTGWEDTPEVFNLIIDFLTYAKETGQTVVVEVD